MNFTQFLSILIARRKIIIITFLFTVLSATIVSLILPKTYTAATSLVLDYKGIDPITGVAVPSQLMPSYMATQIDVITSKNVALKVVDQLKLADSNTVKTQFNEDNQGKGDVKDWLASKLLKKLDVRPSRESSVIDILFSGSDPKFAAAVANAFAAAYQQTSIQLKVEPAQKAAEFLATQTKKLRSELEFAQTRLTKFKQEKGLTSESSNIDIETARLNDISSQLAQAQAQSLVATSRQQSTLGNSNASPDIAANPVVQNIKVQISTAESKFSELSQRLGTNHPQYLAAQAELNKLKGQLQMATTNATSSIVGEAGINNRNVVELKAALEMQKAHVLELNLSRGELSVLERDLDSAQRALDTANLRLTQTTLEGNINQTDISVLNPAIAPLDPTGPKVKLNILLSIILGTLLGTTFALIVEMLDRKVRNVEDLKQLLDVPVFSVVQSSSHPQSWSKFKSISHKLLMLPKLPKSV
jgi:polysaccharide biosynthesis transport protein